MISYRENKPLSIVLTILAVAIIGYTVAVTRNAVKQNYYIGKPTEVSRTITISGSGKVVAVPDIASISLGYSVEKRTVAEAQEDMTKKMNALIDGVKKLGIEAKDIQTTNYSVYPQYDWSTNRQVLRGYQASQNVTVKIRKFDSIPAVLDLIGALQLNQVGGLAFSIDDIEKVRTEAREKALADAKSKAGALAKIMDVDLGKVVSFSESTGGYYPPTPMYYARDAAQGVAEVKATAPAVEGGSQEITVDATVTYELD